MRSSSNKDKASTAIILGGLGTMLVGHLLDNNTALIAGKVACGIGIGTKLIKQITKQSRVDIYIVS